MPTDNEALWLPRPTGRLVVGPAPTPRPGADQIVVRTRALAMNPVDAMPWIGYPVIMPWLTFPAVIGSDVAGDVVEVGDAVTRFAVGDRVLGHAIGMDRARNDPAGGAFQRLVVLEEHLVTRIPDDLGYEHAAVLPLGLSTAAAGLLETDQLGLSAPVLGAAPRDETVLVWGASSSVGTNAVQLARGAGYDVIATASPRNHDLVRRLGARHVVDRRSPTAERDLVAATEGRPVVGTIAIGAGSLARTIRIARAGDGTRRIASVHPSPVTGARGALARRHGVTVTAIWGGTPAHSPVGPAVYRDFLGPALTAGAYVAAPRPDVVGTRLADVPAALDQLRRGVSARKLVVTLDV